LCVPLVFSRGCAWLCCSGGLFGCSAGTCGISRALGGVLKRTRRALEAYSRGTRGVRMLLSIGPPWVLTGSWGGL
jgi:hypothetical protein